MFDSVPQREDDRSLIVDGDEFRSRIAEEVSRSKRYGHPFTVLILRPPKTPDVRDVLDSSWFDSLRRSLVRGCDLVALFEPERAVAVLLPETGVAGAGALLERLRPAIADVSEEWQYAVLEYPGNSDEIEDFMERAA